MKATEAVKKMVAKTNRYLGVSTTTEITRSTRGPGIRLGARDGGRRRAAGRIVVPHHDYRVRTCR